MRKSNPPKSSEKFDGLVFDYLTHLYKLLIEPLLKKLNLNPTEEFWYFLTLGVFSLILYFIGISWHLPFFLLMGAIVVLILENSSYIRRKYFRTTDETVGDFLSELDKKSLDDVLEFITRYSLVIEEIKRLLDSKFKEYYAVYLRIYEDQDIKVELVEYLISKKLIHVMGVELFRKYILRSNETIKYSKYKTV